MRRVPKKDYYLVLGIESNSTFEEIRSAYISRTRVIHPDRFDQKAQPVEWRLANDMLAEMNEAYTVLYNPTSRKQYDAWRNPPKIDHANQSSQDRTSTNQGAQQQTTQAKGNSGDSATSQDVSQLTAGTICFSDLPQRSKDRLIKRQANINEDQLQITGGGIKWNYLFIALASLWFYVPVSEVYKPEVKWVRLF